MTEIHSIEFQYAQTKWMIHPPISPPMPIADNSEWYTHIDSQDNILNVINSYQIGHVS